MSEATCRQNNCVRENGIQAIFASDDFGAVYGAVPADQIDDEGIFQDFNIWVFPNSFDEDRFNFLTGIVAGVGDAAGFVAALLGEL